MAKIAARAFRNGQFNPAVARAGPVAVSAIVRAGATHCDRISRQGWKGDRNADLGSRRGVTGLVNTVAIILVNGKVDRLTGGVDVLQDAVMKRQP